MNPETALQAMNVPRLDRYATLYIFHPILKRVGPAGIRIPILMYHSVSWDRDRTSDHYYQTATTPDVFEEQMRFLRSSGYAALGLDEAAACLSSGIKGADRPVVLTFDDGYMDFHDFAFPVLERLGFTATVFLSTKFIDSHPEEFNGRPCMSWEMVRSLSGRGVSFGSHTVSHPVLKALGAEGIDYEIRKSKERIEDETGLPVTSFSYPYAFPEELAGFRRRLGRTLDAAGYRNGVSTIIGTASANDDRYFLRRIPVNLHDDARLFEAKLAGAYDWVHGVQYGAKVMKYRR